MVAALKDSTVVNLSLENKKRYAQKHNYDVIAIDELGSFSRKPAWAKIPLLFSLLSSGEYDYVWSLDLDTVILRDIPLTDIITPGYDIIIAQDSMGLNTGSFVLRRSTWSRLMLVFMWQQRYYRGSLYYWEQTPLNCLYISTKQGGARTRSCRGKTSYQRLREGLECEPYGLRGGPGAIRPALSWRPRQVEETQSVLPAI